MEESLVSYLTNMRERDPIFWVGSILLILILLQIFIPKISVAQAATPTIRIYDGISYGIPFNITCENFTPNETWDIFLETLNENILLATAIIDENGQYVSNNIQIYPEFQLKISEGKITFQFIQTNSSTIKTKKVLINKPSLIDRTEVELGIPFNIKGRYFSTNRNYTAIVYNGDSENTSIGSAFSDEYGNFRINNCTIMSMGQILLDGLTFEMSVIEEYNLSYYEHTFTFSFNKPKIRSQASTIKKYKYFDVAGYFFAPNIEYDVFLKMRDVEDYYLGSVVANEAGGYFQLLECMILTYDDVYLSDGKVTIYVTESKINNSAIYSARFVYEKTSDLSCIMLFESDVMEDEDILVSIYIVNIGERNEHDLYGEFLINETIIGYYEIPELRAGWYYNVNFTFNLEVGHYTFFSYIQEVESEILLWDNEDFGVINVRESFMEYTLMLKEGWNMVSLPVLPDDTSAEVVLGDVGFYQLITWTGTSYEPAYTFKAGKGYWLLVLNEVNISITGRPLWTIQVDLVPGWNMVSGPCVDVQGADVFPGFFQLLTWSGASYIVASEFTPGMGYWALVLEETSIFLHPT